MNGPRAVTGDSGLRITDGPGAVTGDSGPFSGQSQTISPAGAPELTDSLEAFTGESPEQEQ